MVKVFRVEKPDALSYKWLKRKVTIGKMRIITNTSDKLLSNYRRKKLKNENFTIISNNCVAGFIYKKLGLQYKTPTIGLFFFSEDYIDFLEDIQYYINLPLTFTKFF